MSGKRPVALAALVLALAGCGGGGDGGRLSRDDYVTQFNEIDNRLQTTVRSLNANTSNRDLAKVATKLGRIAAALDDAAGRFAALRPPENAATENADIVAGVRAVAGTFRTGARQARAKQLPQLQRTLQSLASSTGQRRIVAAQKRLRDKGYRVEANQ